MTIQYLLDTNVISEPLRAAPDSGIMRKLERHQAELAIPSIVWHELLVGCYRLPPSKKRSAIEKFLNSLNLPILPYDAEAAKWHAGERARLIGLGRTPPFTDGQMAAVAYTQHLVLVTFNVSDFSVFQGLSLARWHKRI